MAVSKRAVVLAIAIVPALAACQLVLGLNDYTTDGGPITVDAGVEADVAPNDAQIVPEVFATQVDWAAWRMPNPSFDSGTDAKYNFAKLSLSFTDNLDGGADVTLGVYTDKYFGEDAGTGIYWILTPAAGSTKVVADAEAICKARGGRLPSRIELVTLLDFSRNNERRMNGAGVLLPARYWTASPVRPYRADAGVQFWTVSFDGTNGSPVSAASDGADELNVVCVKGQKK